MQYWLWFLCSLQPRWLQLSTDPVWRMLLLLKSASVFGRSGILPPYGTSGRQQMTAWSTTTLTALALTIFTDRRCAQAKPSERLSSLVSRHLAHYYMGRRIAGGVGRELREHRGVCPRRRQLGSKRKWQYYLGLFVIQNLFCVMEFRITEATCLLLLLLRLSCASRPTLYAYCWFWHWWFARLVVFGRSIRWNARLTWLERSPQCRSCAHADVPVCPLKVSCQGRIQGASTVFQKTVRNEEKNNFFYKLPNTWR